MITLLEIFLIVGSLLLAVTITNALELREESADGSTDLIKGWTFIECMDMVMWVLATCTFVLAVFSSMFVFVCVMVVRKHAFATWVRAC